MKFRKKIVAAVVSTIVCAGRWSARVQAEPTTAPVADVNQIVQRATTLIDSSLQLLSVKQTPDDKLYYENGVWHGTYEKGWASYIGAASASAAIWRYGNIQEVAHREQLHRWAIDSINRALKDEQHPDGSLGDINTPETMFASDEICAAYFDLGDSIDEPTRKTWKDAMVKAVDYLVANGNLNNGKRNWYTNGNIELGELQLLHYVYKMTGDEKYKTMIEDQWQFLIAPTEPRWKAFGLVYTKEPTKEDGSDGAAFLGESGGKEPGYDGGYTLLQTSMASRLYMFTREMRYLRLTNLLVNQSLPYVDQTTWIIDTTNGTRRNNRQPYIGPGMAVVGFVGGRTDLAALVSTQFKLAENTFHGGTIQRWASPGMYRALGMEYGTFVRLKDESK